MRTLLLGRLSNSDGASIPCVFVLMVTFGSVKVASGDSVGNSRRRGLVDTCGCGGVALMVLGRELGHDWSSERVERACGMRRSGAGMSIDDLCTSGRRLGVDLVPIECGFDEVRELLPAILFIPRGPQGHPHFVVGAEGANEALRIVDPPQVERWLSRSELKELGWRFAIVPRHQLERRRREISNRAPWLAVVSASTMTVGILFWRRSRTV